MSQPPSKISILTRQVKIRILQVECRIAKVKKTRMKLCPVQVLTIQNRWSEVTQTLLVPIIMGRRLTSQVWWQVKTRILSTARQQEAKCGWPIVMLLTQGKPMQPTPHQMLISIRKRKMMLRQGFSLKSRLLCHLGRRMIVHLTNRLRIKILAQAITSIFTLLKIHPLQAKSPRCRRIRLSLNSKE